MYAKTKTVKAFLWELSELTKKYNLVIEGCGCCGSPWVESVDLKEKNRLDFIYVVKVEHEELTFTHPESAKHRHQYNIVAERPIDL